MHGHWPWLPMIVWPNTIVALGVDKVTDKYNWVIEFQCVEYFNRVAFTGACKCFMTLWFGIVFSY